MTLRDHLWFHDGQKVLARDDRTSVVLKRKFPALPRLLSKFQTAAVMIPERLAETDSFKQIPEAISSGPFRFLADEYVVGSHAALVPYRAIRPVR